MSAVILLRGMSIVMSLRARLEPYQTDSLRVAEHDRIERLRATAPWPLAPPRDGFALARSGTDSETLIDGLALRKKAAAGTFVNDNA